MAFAKWCDTWCTGVEGDSYDSVRHCLMRWCNEWIDSDWLVDAFDLSAILAWLVVFLCTPRESRSFAVRALFFAFVSRYFSLTLYLAEQDAWAQLAARTSILGVAPTMLALSAAGPARVAGIPRVGPRIVRVLMWQPWCNRSPLPARFWRPADEADTASEADTDSDSETEAKAGPSARDVNDDTAATLAPPR